MERTQYNEMEITAQKKKKNVGTATKFNETKITAQVIKRS